MVRGSPIQSNSQVDWIGFVSDVLAIKLHINTMRSRCSCGDEKRWQSFGRPTLCWRRYLLRNAATSSRSSLNVFSKAVKVRFWVPRQISSAIISKFICA